MHIWCTTKPYIVMEVRNGEVGISQGLVKGDKICLYPDFFGCRSTRLHVENKSQDI